MSVSFSNFVNIQENNVDIIFIRNALIRKYQPENYPEPYFKQIFEINNPIGKGGRQSLLNTFISLPIDLAKKLWDTSDTLALIRREASCYSALEKVYLGPFENPVREKKKYLFTRLMLENIMNSMATRNRKRIINIELENFANGIRSQNKNYFTILSIGAGSARAIIEGAALLKSQGFKFHLLLVDHDPEALASAELLAKENGIQSNLKTVVAKFYEFNKFLDKNQKIDFVEIVGLLDYLNDRSIEFLLLNIYKYINDYGLILYSNVAHNDEEKFLHTIVDWPLMIYRDAKHLMNFASNTGFRNPQLIHEPTGFVSVVKARK